MAGRGLPSGSRNEITNSHVFTEGHITFKLRSRGFDILSEVAPVRSTFFIYLFIFLKKGTSLCSLKLAMFHTYPTIGLF